ncbi:DEAD/DEAH box helicase [Pseudomonas putida]|nr:DEAD/DEAH box helicase [Pseudomonas putida]
MSERDILRALLEFELRDFAVKLGFVSGGYSELPYELLLKSLNLLKGISNRESSDFNNQMAIMIVALLWTHAGNSRRDGLRQILAPILSTMGFSPSNLMLDKSLKEEGVYSPISSYFDKIRIVAHDLKNQVLVADRVYTLTGFQAELWKVIDESNLIGISAPTSAGKSFLIYLKIIDLISKGGSRVVYVVPTLSLIGQVMSDLTKLLREHGFLDIDVLSSFEENVDNFIYVVTQERAIVLFSDQGVEHLDLLVVDEVQNLEKVGSDSENRPKILYDILTDVRNDIDVGKIILSGPRLRNIGNLGFRVFGEISSEKTTDAPPVLSLTYSILKKDNKFFLNQYSTIFENPIQLEVENYCSIQGLGQVQYTKKFNEYLHYVLDRLAGDVNIVFSPTSNQARKSAHAYAESKAESKFDVASECAGLAQYLRDSVHPKYELASIIESGAAYHTGKTPMHARKSIEYAASKCWIDTLFCTTTLMQGVNLPAKNVVIRNPNLYTKRQGGKEATLSAYEFANLRGRAGRLLTDFIGRTVVLDEEAFSAEDEGDERGAMFPDKHKEISTGYQDIYDRNAEQVESALAGRSVVDGAAPKSLVIYIRQVLFRYGLEGESRLKNVGLYIDKSLLASSLAEMAAMRVDKKVVMANRYWDPLDLDRLYRVYGEAKNKFPTNVFERNLCQSLLEWIFLMRNEFPFYYGRYLKLGLDDKYLFGIAKSAESWAREMPMIDILINRFGRGGEGLDEKIDSEIEKLTKYVSFGLPMLLKPLADIRSSDSSIISAIELGVYSPISKYLMSRGVPRETAIRVSRLYGEVEPAKKIEGIDFSFLKGKLNSWELQHLGHIL